MEPAERLRSLGRSPYLRSLAPLGRGSPGRSLKVADPDPLAHSHRDLELLSQLSRASSSFATYCRRAVRRSTTDGAVAGEGLRCASLQTRVGEVRVSSQAAF